MSALRCFMVAIAVVIVGSPALAEDKLLPPRIEVYGEAEALLEPDYIEWVVDIRTQDKVPKLAREVNDKLYELLLDIADQADIDEKDIVSGDPTYEQQFDEEREEEADISDYTGTEVYRRVTLVMRDMDELEEMIDAVHPLGVFYAVRRKSSRYDEVARRVEVAAIKEARMMAIEQAAALGQNIGKAIYVDVYHYSGSGGEGGLFGPPEKPIKDDPASAGPDGKIRVAAYADVIFRLE